MQNGCDALSNRPFRGHDPASDRPAEPACTRRPAWPGVSFVDSCKSLHQARAWWEAYTWTLAKPRWHVLGAGVAHSSAASLCAVASSRAASRHDRRAKAAPTLSWVRTEPCGGTLPWWAQARPTAGLNRHERQELAEKDATLGPRRATGLSLGGQDNQSGRGVIARDVGPLACRPC